MGRDRTCFLFFLFIFILIFGCSGSSLLLRLFSSCGEQGYSLVSACGLPTAVASLVTEHQALGKGSVVVIPRLQSTGSIAVAHGFAAQQHVGSSQTRD